MVLTDIYCSDHEHIRSNAREFAYMGQGEPGFSYKQVREAITLTNFAMNELRQSVFRHIIATSGVPQMIRAYKDDLQNNFFSSRVTMHFSLHATKKRKIIMPIETLYPYQESLTELSDIISVSGEKPCIGILLLNNFIPLGSIQSYTTTLNDIEEMLTELNPTLFRLSFCEFNGYSDLGAFEEYDSSQGKEILSYAKNLGFEAKLFSSFGKDEITACGMLGGKFPENTPSIKWLELERQSEQIISQALKNI